jgi:RNA 2',3'-cyclic 3'-phosphodiesterase
MESRLLGMERMNLRCFIAIGIPEQLQREISECIEILKKHNADIKWVRPENLHLTIKFLGNTPGLLLPNIHESLTRVVSTYEPFYITIYGTGMFPNKKYPRVIWAGVHDSGRIKPLMERVDGSMSLLGFKKEDRAFSPHLTLGRVRSQRGMIMFVDELDTFKEKEFGAMPVDRILIMKSDLTPKGPEYACVHTIPFGSNAVS